MVNNYYHKRDLQTIQTREIVAMMYNVNRSKGAPKEGKDFMLTFEESETSDQEIPNDEIVKKIQERYGS